MSHRFGHLLPSFQTMQVCAAAGITRIALILGVAEQPITADNIPEDVIMRQVRNPMNFCVFTPCVFII